MNATEQRMHRTVTAGLTQRVNDLETIVHALDERVSSMARIIKRLHADMMEGDANSRERLATFQMQSFWARVRWLVGW